MSVIARFKKKGGLLQLLQLVETSTLSKRDKFLHLIEDESPAWAEAVREKILTFEKLLSVEDNLVVEIFSDMKTLNLAAASYAMQPQQKARILKILPTPLRRKLEDQIEIIKPSESEIANSVAQILTEIRVKIDSDRSLLQKIDPKLKIEEDLEDRLLGYIKDEEEPSYKKEDSKVLSTGNLDADDEILRLRKKIKDMQNEIDRIKIQNHDLKAKLERILKLAS